MNSQSKLPFADCKNCSLYDCPVVPSSGPKNASLVVIGEAPGATEVEQGKPFVGPSGSLLDYALDKAGVSPDDVFKTNVVACRPPGNREPHFLEIAACRERLMHELDYQKAPVLALGKVAREALDMDSYKMGTIFEWNHRRAIHTYHPAYLLRKPDESSVLFNDVDKLVNGVPEIGPEWLDPEVCHVTDTRHLEEMLSQCPDDAWVAFDIETDQLRWYELFDGTPPDPILMLQLVWEDAYGNLLNVVIDDEMLYDTPETKDILNKFFARVQTCAHNGKFDMVFLKSHIGIDIHLDFDTMLAHAVIDENSKHGLKEVVSSIWGIPDWEEELKQYLSSRNDRYSKVPFEVLSKYGVIDVIMTLQLQKRFERILIEQDRLAWPFMSIHMRASNRFVFAELRGIKIDTEYLIKVQGIMEGEMDRIALLARESVGRSTLNLQSPQQVAEVIYDQLKFPPPKSRKLGKRSTSKEATEPLKGRHPFIDYLVEYRRVAKMKQSYADNILEALDINGCVHASFVVQGTEVGRISVREPALQTIPRAEGSKDNKGFWGAMIKAAFVARPGMKLVVVDYSQAELRVAAVLANEPFLIDVYEHNRDLHSEVAIAMFGEGYTKEQRMNTKMFNFSYLYGGSEYSFALDAGLPILVAKKFVQDYNKVMPKLAQFRKDQFALLDKQGYVQSPLGRRRHFEIITRVNEDDARKACVHAPVAGTASDLTLLSGCQLDEEGFNLLLVVHDSVVLEVPEEDAEYVATYAQKVMEERASYHLPQVKWKADPEVKDRWADVPMVLA